MKKATQEKLLAEGWCPVEVLGSKTKSNAENRSAKKSRNHAQGGSGMVKSKSKSSKDSKRVGGSGSAPAKQNPKQGSVIPEEKVSKKRIAFAPDTHEALNEEGTFTVATPEGFSFEKNLVLKKSDFSAKYLFLTHKADAERYKGEQSLARAKKLDGEAALAEKIGDGKTEKKVKKLEKLHAALAALEAELKGDGIDLEGLGIGEKEEEEGE